MKATFQEFIRTEVLYFSKHFQTKKILCATFWKYKKKLWYKVKWVFFFQEKIGTINPYIKKEKS